MEQSTSPEQVFSYPQEVIDEIRQKAISEVRTKTHRWRQRGAWVVCTSCEYEHAIYVGVGRLLLGINEDGSPKLS